MVKPRHRRLQELAAHLSESVDSAQIIDLIAQEGVIALDAHAGLTTILTRDGRQFQSTRVTPHPEAKLPPNVIDAWDTFAADTPLPITDAVRAREILVLETREERDRRYPHLAHRDEPMNAWVVSPILLPSGPIGAIELHFPRPLRLEEEDRAYILTLADLCAQALDRARLDEALRADSKSRIRLKTIVRRNNERARSLRREFQMLKQQFEMLREEHERLVMRQVPPVRALPGPDESEAWKKMFLRETLASATAGGLHLCYNAGELPEPLVPINGAIDLSLPGGVRELRHRALAAAKDMGFPSEREFDLEVAVGEVGTNAVAHAGGGIGTVSVEPGQRIQVRVTDHGRGIPLEDLPKATLARGYSTRATLGHGFKIVLQTIDNVYLLTEPTGTTIVLEQEKRAPSMWEGLL